MRLTKLFLSVWTMGLGLAMWASLAIGVATAQTIVVPNSLATLEGDGNFSIPFGATSTGSIRYQQVFDASDFASLPGPSFISQIAFRLDASFSAVFSETILNIQINLSTTASAPDAMSNFFAINVGSDETVVFSGALAMSSLDTGPPAGPKDFDIVINLQTPYLYDPMAGNLLMDVRNFQTLPPFTVPPFDSSGLSGDSISHIENRPVTVNGGGNDTRGLVAQFTFASAVPTLSCVGFEPPLEDGPVTVKKNRALPLKAQLLDSDSILVTDSDIVSPPVIQVLFDSGTEPAMDVTGYVLSAGQGTDGNQFVFTDDLKWQFNLKTKNYSAAGTYTVTMESGDESEYTISPICIAEFVIN